MSKNTKTAAISFPTELLKDIDEAANSAGISRSALVTAMTSFTIKWMKEASIQAKKDALNSVYGRKILSVDTDAVYIEAVKEV